MEQQQQPVRDRCLLLTESRGLTVALILIHRKRKGHNVLVGKDAEDTNISANIERSVPGRKQGGVGGRKPLMLQSWLESLAGKEKMENCGCHLNLTSASSLCQAKGATGSSLLTAKRTFVSENMEGGSKHKHRNISQQSAQQT